MSLQCYRKGQSTYLVRLSALSHSFRILRPKAPDSIIDKYTYLDKGITKIAKDLGIDYAEAVVRATLTLHPKKSIPIPRTGRCHSSSRIGRPCPFYVES